MFLKLVRRNGSAFFDGAIEYKVGETVWVRKFNPSQTCGDGLHYGEDIDTGIFLGFAWLGREVNQSFCPSAVPFHEWTNFRVLEVETRGKTVEISHGKFKAEGLFVRRELPPREFLPMMLKSKAGLVRTIAAAHPALLEIFKPTEVKELISGDESAREGFQINPANPERLKPGDTVETTPSYSQFLPFPPIRNGELLEIDDQRVAVVKTRDSKRTLGVAWLRNKVMLSQMMRLRETINRWRYSPMKK